MWRPRGLAAALASAALRGVLEAQGAATRAAVHGKDAAGRLTPDMQQIVTTLGEVVEGMEAERTKAKEFAESLGKECDESMEPVKKAVARRSGIIGGLEQDLEDLNTEATDVPGGAKLPGVPRGAYASAGPLAAMASGAVQLWAWILHNGDQGWQQRRVLGHLQPPGANPVNDFLIVCATPDADVYFELVDGTSPDYQAVRFSPDRRTIPPGIARGQTYRFRREPTAAELAAFMGQARQAADDLYIQQAAAAGLPAVAPPGGAFVPFVPPAAGAPAGGQPAAAAGPAGAAPLAGGAAPAAAGAQWVTVESTTFASRGTPVVLSATDVVKGEVGIFTTPAGVAVLVRDLQAHPVEEYMVMESHRDLRISKATVIASKDRARSRFTSSDVQLRESPFPDWPVPGPRAVKWCCVWLFRRQGGPLEHHRSLVMTFGLRSADWGVETSDSGTCCLFLVPIQFCIEALVELLYILAGALRALRAKSAYGEGAVIAPLSMDAVHLIDLPAAGSVSRSLEHLAGDRGKEIAERLIQLRLPESTGREIAKLQWPARPYSDPALKRSPALCAELLRRMADCDLIEWHLTGEVSCGLFFVYKKSGRYRLIVDGRLPSCHFRDGDPVSLASGAAFSAIEVDSAAPIQVGSVDIVNAFYNVQLPEALRGIFVLPRIRADLVNVSSAQGRAIRRGQYLFPVLKVPEGAPDIGSDVWDGEWRRVLAKRWARSEAQVILEGRSMVLAHLHKTLSLAIFGKRHLFLGDAMASILAVSKGRSSSKLMRVCRQIGSLNLAFNMTSRWRWLPSERNPADRGSRRKRGDWAEASTRPREADPPPAALPAPRHAPLGGDSYGQRDRRVRAFAASLGRAFGVDFGPSDECRKRPAAGRPPPSRGIEPNLRADGGEPATDEHGLTLLESRTVKKPQEDRYKHIVSQFYLWCATANVATSNTTQLDSAVTAYLHEQFFEGFPSSAGTFLLAALTYCRQDLSPKAPELPRARRALLGFSRAAPNRSRWPLPWPFVALIADALIGRGHWAAAAATLLCFVFYTRPSELLRLRVKGAVPPPRGGPRALALWALLLTASENSAPSKTGEFDVSLSHDNTEFWWVGGLLTRLRAGRSATQPLLGLTYATRAALFSRAAVDAGLGGLGPPTLYQLRHGGASHELATRARPLAEIKKRGRWAADSSVRRYEMSGLLPTQLQRASEAVQRRAYAAAASIGSNIL
ncbi:unnamed protein product, partial [Prorocentrum cordatum]